MLPIASTVVNKKAKYFTCCIINTNRCTAEFVEYSKTKIEIIRHKYPYKTKKLSNFDCIAVVRILLLNTAPVVTLILDKIRS